jgi:FPC/CPF motif-containing protein YcgG
MHGFVSEIVIGLGARSFEDVRRGFRSYLNGLADHDEDCRRTLNGDKLRSKWQFSFAGMQMFLNVFAPCYEQPHSKFIASDDSFWVLFQPEFSFGLCGVDSSRGELKQQIREKFSSCGMPYNGEMIDRRIEALLYMFPQRITDDPVRWWVD